jgi:cytochrome c-type biogenesis protein CcmH/NrfG
MLGLVYTSTGDLDLAADALTRACDLDPSNSNARSALVRVRQRLGP